MTEPASGLWISYFAYEQTGGEWSIQRTADEFGVTPAQVHAALSYYYDHREEIDREIKESDAFVEEFRRDHQIQTVDEWLKKRQSDES